MKVLYASLESNGDMRKVLEMNTGATLPETGDTCRFRTVDAILIFRVLERSFYFSEDPDSEGKIQIGATIILTQLGLEPIAPPVKTEENENS
jgi:hypothetical protein